MKTKLLSLVIGFSSVCFSHTTGNQVANNASCSNTKIDAKGNVTFKCSGLSPDQAKILNQMPLLLDKLLHSQNRDAEKIVEKLDLVLANQKNTEPLVEKLDQILENLNPNRPVKTYFCDGKWKTTGPGASSAMEINMGGDDSVFKQIIDLANGKQYQALLSLCEDQMKSKPEWLTPYLFSSWAYARLGDIPKAKEMLAHFDTNEGPAYEVSACKQASDQLHSQLGVTASNSN